MYKLQKSFYKHYIISFSIFQRRIDQKRINNNTLFQSRYKNCANLLIHLKLKLKLFLGKKYNYVNK